MRPSLLFLFHIIISQSQLPAQNLLQNGSFEEHLPIECMNCHLRADDFSNTMKHWHNMNTHSFICICDCMFKNENAPKTKGLCYSGIKPQEGCTTMEMNYKPACLDWEHETRGCASLLGNRMEQPLEIGKIYEVSFWLYIMPPDDPGYEQHIGMNIYPDIFRNPNGAISPPCTTA